MTDARAVYFIGGTGTFIKIGVAKNPQRRLRAIQTCSPTPLRLLAYIPGAGFEGEREMHQRFAGDRAHGEWFRPSPELLGLIAETARANADAAQARLDELATTPAAHPPLMTSFEVAQLLGMSVETVSRKARSGELRSVHPAGLRRFRGDYIRGLLAEVAS